MKKVNKVSNAHGRGGVLTADILIYLPRSVANNDGNRTYHKLAEDSTSVQKLSEDSVSALQKSDSPTNQQTSSLPKLSL